MKVTNEIKKMNANELMNNFTDIVETTQDWKNETTILKFENEQATICNGDVKWECLYTPSENVSHIDETGTREEFYNWFVQCTDWYNNEVKNDEFNGTIEEYAEMLCETELTPVD